MPKNKLLPLTYLGSVQYFAHILNSDSITIEQHANYQRKTFANRCLITGANGPLSLAIPVVNIKNAKTAIKDTRISYDTNWQKQHWRSIVSGYNSSPFFEFYADDFAPFYEKGYKYLVDYNLSLISTVLDQIEVEKDIKLSESYVNTDQTTLIDLKRNIHPKVSYKDDPDYQLVEYRQVFLEKYPFEPNLSVIDLLFCKGPETYEILMNSIKL